MRHWSVAGDFGLDLSEFFKYSEEVAAQVGGDIRFGWVGLAELTIPKSGGTALPWCYLTRVTLEMHIYLT